MLLVIIIVLLVMDKVNMEVKKRGRPADSGGSPSLRVKKYRYSMELSGRRQVSIYLSEDILKLIDLQAVSESGSRSDVVEKLIRSVLLPSTEAKLSE